MVIQASQDQLTAKLQVPKVEQGTKSQLTNYKETTRETKKTQSTKFSGMNSRKQSTTTKLSQLPGFNQSDQLIMKILSLMTKTCMETFDNRGQMSSKKQLKLNIIDFTIALTKMKSSKEIIRAIQE